MDVAQDARSKALRKWRALLNLTVQRGATMHEAAVAAKLAKALAAKFGFGNTDKRDFREDFASRFARAEQRAARRWAWEYRTCGKGRCHCMRGDGKHGPYKYGKKRTGRKVVSIYVGK